MTERTERSESVSATDRWVVAALAEFARGGEDRTEECLRLGADPRVVEKALAAREQVLAHRALEEQIAARGVGIAAKLTAATAAPKAVAAAPAKRPKVSWVEELEAAPAAERIALGVRLVADGRAAEGQVAEVLDGLGVARREFMEALAVPTAGSLAERMAGVRVGAETVRKIAKALPEPEPEETDEAAEEEPEAELDPEDFVDAAGAAATGRALVVVPEGEIILPVSASAAAQVELLNQKHAVIGNYGGKCAVLSWERWSINPKVRMATFQTFTDFRNRYMNKYAERETDEGGVKHIAAGKYWLSHPKRVTYEGVVLEPGKSEVLEGNRLNLWRGFAVRPRRGCWKLLRNHIYRVLGNGDRKAGRYIVRWLAWMFQNPGRAAEAVLVFQGEEGAGKGTLARALLKIFGINGLPVTDARLFVGTFSGHLHYCVFLFVDEAFWAGNVAAEGRLKGLVTEETITIEPKYFTPFSIRNMLHIMMSSNDDWVVPAGRGARRYAVFKASKDRVGDFNYFDELNAELDGGGIEAMLWDLLRLRLGDWHPKMIYKTAALTEQKQQSLRGLDAWAEAFAQKGRLAEPLSRKYPNRCLTQHLLASAKEHDKFTNDTRVALYLQKVFGVTEFNVQSARGWAFPPLAECRRLWEKRNGGHWHWYHDVSEWWVGERPV